MIPWVCYSGFSAASKCRLTYKRWLSCWGTVGIAGPVLNSDKISAAGWARKGNCFHGGCLIQQSRDLASSSQMPFHGVISAPGTQLCKHSAPAVAAITEKQRLPAPPYQQRSKLYAEPLSSRLLHGWNLRLSCLLSGLLGKAGSFASA